MAKKFSPPYGDGTFEEHGFVIGVRFSPPYGDRTDPASSLVVDG